MRNVHASKEGSNPEHGRRDASDTCPTIDLEWIRTLAEALTRVTAGWQRSEEALRFASALAKTIQEAVNGQARPDAERFSRGEAPHGAPAQDAASIDAFYDKLNYGGRREWRAD